MEDSGVGSYENDSENNGSDIKHAGQKDIKFKETIQKLSQGIYQIICVACIFSCDICVLF